MPSIFNEISDTAVETEHETTPIVPMDTSPDNEIEPTSPVAAKEPAKKWGRPRKQPSKTICEYYMHLQQ